MPFVPVGSCAAGQGYCKMHLVCTRLGCCAYALSCRTHAMSYREQYVDLVLVDGFLLQHSFYMLLNTVAFTSQDGLQT